MPQPDIHFPESIKVTEQEISLSEFSNSWKDQVEKLAKKIALAYQKQNKERFVVAMAGPSGTGKSSVAAVLEHLLPQLSTQPVKVAGVDGYHFTQAYLNTNTDAAGEPLAHHKGRFDTMNTEAFAKDLAAFKAGENVSFPLYSRKLHDPIPNKIHCTAADTLLILEGLWLLYDRAPWKDLCSLYDLTIFLHANPTFRKANTITRHLRGKEHSQQEVERFYEESDAVNAQLILENVVPPDLDVKL